MDDDALVVAAQAGDRQALETLLRGQHDRLFALARRMLGDRRDAEDATQDALIAIVRGLHRFDGRSAFSTWSYRVATNVCLDELRRRQRRPSTVELVADTVASTRGPVDPQVADRLLVDGALAALPDDFRAAVVLRDLCDLEYAEIGEVLGIPPGTVRSRIARGRAQLARYLSDRDQVGGQPGGNQPGSDQRRSEVP